MVYKLLLCWRYLLTRCLPLACIISVMLGVAILIVVNSVMSGFSTKLQKRLRDMSADIVIESKSADGIWNYQAKIDRAMAAPVGNEIEVAAPTMESIAMLQFRINGREGAFPHPIRLIGIEPASRAKMGALSEYLVRQKNNPK